MAPLAFVPEGQDPSMMGGPKAIEGGEGEMAEGGGGGEGFGGDPSDFADDAGATSQPCQHVSNHYYVLCCRDLQELWDDEPPRSWGTNERLELNQLTISFPIGVFQEGEA